MHPDAIEFFALFQVHGAVYLLEQTVISRFAGFVFVFLV